MAKGKNGRERELAGVEGDPHLAEYASETYKSMSGYLRLWRAVYRVAAERLLRGDEADAKQARDEFDRAHLRLFNAGLAFVEFARIREGFPTAPFDREPWDKLREAYPGLVHPTRPDILTYNHSLEPRATRRQVGYILGMSKKHGIEPQSLVTAAEYYQRLDIDNIMSPRFVGLHEGVSPFVHIKHGFSVRECGALFAVIHALDARAEASNEGKDQ